MFRIPRGALLFIFYLLSISHVSFGIQNWMARYPTLSERARQLDFSSLGGGTAARGTPQCAALINITCNSSVDCFGGFASGNQVCCNDMQEEVNMSPGVCLDSEALTSLDLNDDCLVPRSGDDTQCYNRCKPVTAGGRNLLNFPRCVADSNGSQEGTCLFGKPNGCECTDDTECENRLCLQNDIGSSQCDYYRAGEEPCTRPGQGQCAGASQCIGNRCNSVGENEPCSYPVFNYAVSECAPGFYCDVSATMNTFQDILEQFRANTIVNGVCRPNRGLSDPCTIADRVWNSCGPGNICDLPTSSVQELATRCYNNNISGNLADCGTCRPLASGDIGDNCTGTASCKLGLFCDPNASDTCQIYNGGLECEENVIECPLGTECRCDDAEVEYTCKPVDNNTFAALRDCADEYSEWVSACFADNGCRRGITEAFNRGSCEGDCFESAGGGFYCCLAERGVISQSDKGKCGLLCTDDSTRFEFPDKPCCTGIGCSTFVNPSCDCYDDDCKLIGDDTSSNRAALIATTVVLSICFCCILLIACTILIVILLVLCFGICIGSSSALAVGKVVFGRGGGESVSAMDLMSSGESDSEFDRMGNSKKGTHRTSKDSRAVLAAANWHIDYEDLKIQNPPIGQGAFGVVNKAVYKGTLVAVKTIVDNKLSDTVEEFVQEVDNLSRLHHPNIVLFMGASDAPPAIVTEFVIRGSLFDVLRDSPDSITWKIIRKITKGTARGMAYLHGQTPPYIHRDLKGGNILLTKQFEPKICDFGISRPATTATMTVRAGTTRWTAPEIIRGGKYTEKADTYSFSVVLWEMMAKGELPFQEERWDSKVEDRVLAGERPRVEESWPSDYVDIMNKCWEPDAEDRPDFEVIVELAQALPKSI